MGQEIGVNYLTGGHKKQKILSILGQIIDPDVG